MLPGTPPPGWGKRLTDNLLPPPTAAQLSQFNSARQIAALQTTTVTASNLVIQDRAAIDNQKAVLQQAQLLQQIAYTAWSANQTNPTLIANLTAANNAYNTEKTKLTTLTQKLSTDVAAQASAIAAYNKAVFVKSGGKVSNSSGGGTSTTAPGSSNPPATVPYIYNIPMVKEAYLTSGKGNAYYNGATEVIQSPQSNSLKNNNTLQNNLSKGRMLMSSLFPNLNSSVKLTPGKVPDNTYYGFKFLYNPTTVSMGWGVATDINPFFLASGKNQSVMGTLQSSVTFSLLLNRTLDMNYLDANGLKSSVTNPYPTNTPPPADDLKLLYERGTMYDLEYLFKLTGGKLATHKSPLTGLSTADSGWLNPLPVELYLGKGLHYLVRIVDLSLNHTMFDERMVPIMTEVNITCMRYYDSVAATGVNQQGQLSFQP